MLNKTPWYVQHDTITNPLHRITLSYFHHPCPAAGLLSLLSAGGLLRTLDIRGCSQLSELCLMGLQRAAFTSTNLKTLDLRGMAIADIAFGWVAQGCKVLESLNISRCPLLTDLALEYLAKGSGEARPTPLKVGLFVHRVPPFTSPPVVVAPHLTPAFAGELPTTFHLVVPRCKVPQSCVVPVSLSARMSRSILSRTHIIGVYSLVLVLVLLMSNQVLNVAGVGGFTDEGMSILMPRSGPTLQDITLDGATSLGKERGSQGHLHWATR